MAAVPTYLAPFKTGLALTNPIVIKAGGLNVGDYITQLTIAVGTTTLQLGGLCMVTTTAMTADVPVAKDFKTGAIILCTAHNFRVLEDAGVTVAIGAAFPASVIIDVLILVPGMVLSMIHDSVATLDVFDDVRVAAAGEVAALAAIATDADPRTKIGMSLTMITGTTGTKQRIAVLVK